MLVVDTSIYLQQLRKIVPMGLKAFGIIGVIVLLMSCNSNTQGNVETSTQENDSELTEADIANLKYLEFALDYDVANIVEPWDVYTRLRETIESVKKADFSFFHADEKAAMELIKEMKASVPDTLNTPSVLSRILVMETMLQKMQETSGLSTVSKTELSNVVKDVLIAYSNLNFQLNKKLERDKQKILRPN